MTPDARAYIEQHGGKVPDRRIAQHLNCAEITVRKERAAMGIAGYRGRPDWTRRDCLLAGAAAWWSDDLLHNL